MQAKLWEVIVEEFYLNVLKDILVFLQLQPLSITITSHNDWRAYLKLLKPFFPCFSRKPISFSVIINSLND